MEKDEIREGRALTRRQMLGALGTAGATLLAASAASSVSAQSTTQATATPTVTDSVTPTLTETATLSITPTFTPTSTTLLGLAGSPPLQYLNEWNALRDVLSALEDRYDKNFALFDGLTGFLLSHVARSLRQFGEGQFNFFYQGFNTKRTGSSDYPPLTPSIQFSPEEAIATTLAQISEDTAAIQQIAEQRLWGLTVPSVGTSMGAFLQETDGLAATALWPGEWVPDLKPGDPTIVPFLKPEFEHIEPRRIDQRSSGDGYSGHFDIRAVLTYFKKSVDVRIVPYARVALIGIPFGTLHNTQELLAIPHEVGHFLYWYSRDNGTGRYANIRESNPYLKVGDLGIQNWREEMFADIYGVLRGGPIAVLTTMDLAMEHSANEFSDFSGNEVHPAPKIRPLVMIKALANFSTSVSSVKQGSASDPADSRWQLANDLLGEWQSRVIARGLKLDDSDVTAITSNSVALAPGMELDSIIQDHLTSLDKVMKKALDWGWSDPRPIRAAAATAVDGSKAVANLDSYMKSGGQFDGYKSKVPYPLLDPSALIDFPDLGDPNKLPILWRQWVQAKAYLAPKYFMPPGNSLSPVKSGTYPEDMVPGLSSTPDDHWIRVFGATGWTTGGPCSDKH